MDAQTFGFNGVISEYYEENTLKEILLAKNYLAKNPPEYPSQMLVLSSLLHILHGNRPYALSRNSHPIVPYAPSGEYVYKNLIKHLTDKVLRSYKQPLPENFAEGKIFNRNITLRIPFNIAEGEIVVLGASQIEREGEYPGAAIITIVTAKIL